MPLPEGVHAVPVNTRAGRAIYYYWAPRRGLKDAPKPIPLGKDATTPEFWKRLAELKVEDPRVKEGSFAKLIAKYKASPRFDKHKPRTQEFYRQQLDRVDAAWGTMQVAELTVAGIYKLREQYEDTPVAANHLISVLRTLLRWGLAHGFGKLNPAREIERLEILDEEHAKPWPEQTWRFVITHAPLDIRRAAFLGRACGQRRSDLVKFGPQNRRDDGLAIRIGKLRDKFHVIPLTKAQLAEIDSWTTPHGEAQHIGPWIISPIGRTMSGDALGAALDRYVERTAELKGLELNWHGLRAMAAIDRKLAGAENRAIGASLRMSTATVERYIKHIDELQLARGVRDRLEERGQ